MSDADVMELPPEVKAEIQAQFIQLEVHAARIYELLGEFGFTYVIRNGTTCKMVVASKTMEFQGS